jgi:PilZ domain-containing protein
MLQPPDYNLKKEAETERRHSVRICCTGFAEGVSANPTQLFRGEIRNVSETGCFISLRVAVKLLPGTYVELRFRMGSAQYRALARVVEAIPSNGIRMRFVAIDPAFTDRMRQILSAKPGTR